MLPIPVRIPLEIHYSNKDSPLEYWNLGFSDTHHISGHSGSTSAKGLININIEE